MNKLAAVLITAAMHGGDSIATSPSVDEIVGRLMAADRIRQASFAGYSGIRTYVVENARFGVRAAMKVEIRVDRNGAKQFRIIEMNGPAAIRKLVFQRMLNTEAEASRGGSQQSTKISPENYRFGLVELADVNGHRQFVLEAEPKTSNPLLFRGRIWVDSVDAAVVKIEGAPAKSPSFWVRKTQFVHEYKKTGELWLAATNVSETEVRMFGRTMVRIEYGEYRLGEPAAAKAVQRMNAATVVLSPSREDQRAD